MLDAFQIYSFICSCPTELFEKQRLSINKLNFYWKKICKRLSFKTANTRANLKTYLQPRLIGLCKVVVACAAEVIRILLTVWALLVSYLQQKCSNIIQDIKVTS